VFWFLRPLPSFSVYAFTTYLRGGRIYEIRQAAGREDPRLVFYKKLNPPLPVIAKEQSDCGNLNHAILFTRYEIRTFITQPPKPDSKTKTLHLCRKWVQSTNILCTKDSIEETQKIGRVHHRLINIEEPTGTSYTERNNLFFRIIQTVANEMESDTVFLFE
jgi:hypothetical protein